MSNQQASYVRDASKAATTGSTALFPEVPWGSIQERFVHNPSASNPIAIRFVPAEGLRTSFPAALNTAGSIMIPAGATWVGSVCNAIEVIGTAAGPVTAGER